MQFGTEPFPEGFMRPQLLPDPAARPLIQKLGPGSDLIDPQRLFPDAVRRTLLELIHTLSQIEHTQPEIPENRMMCQLQHPVFLSLRGQKQALTQTFLQDTNPLLEGFLLFDHHLGRRGGRWGPAIGGAIENWFAYMLAMVFLLFRPQGLFGERIIERV